MHFQVGIFTEPVDLDEVLLTPPHGFEGLAFFGAPIGPPFPGGSDQGFQFVTAAPLTERRAKIEAVFGVEAEIPHPVGRQPAAIAGAAERRRG